MAAAEYYNQQQGYNAQQAYPPQQGGYQAYTPPQQQGYAGGYVQGYPPQQIAPQQGYQQQFAPPPQQQTTHLAPLGGNPPYPLGGTPYGQSTPRPHSSPGHQDRYSRRDSRHRPEKHARFADEEKYRTSSCTPTCYEDGRKGRGEYDRRGRARYSRSQSRSRSRSRHRDRNRSRSRSRSRSRDWSRDGSRDSHHHHNQKGKNSGVGTFLGAGGGAVLGDAIFPGLGTLGGAILGGLGGRRFEKEREDYRYHEGERY
ncbi:hypothetical protein K470DRAFT_261048 [Piedraia hortae CBS 480.64]|uniref:Glycine zipper domain-containing protein n=1 Tax=Piedraia hortae CBS 480.64 TaxID=1314780 RepID=A0A6A7BQP4_9PEZI|nr:hypothetical protein K470DRAFT_261048 [Piedraia hortae CBS 480.64]